MSSILKCSKDDSSAPPRPVPSFLVTPMMCSAQCFPCVETPSVCLCSVFIHPFSRFLLNMYVSAEEETLTWASGFCVVLICCLPLRCAFLKPHPYPCSPGLFSSSLPSAVWPLKTSSFTPAISGCSSDSVPQSWILYQATNPRCLLALGLPGQGDECKVH